MKKKYIGILGLVIMSLSGCQSKDVASMTEIESVPEVTQPKEEKQVVEVWSYYKGWEEVEEAFEEIYPDVELNFTYYAYNEYVEAYLEGLKSQNVPDVMIVDSTHMGQFNTLDVFEDLKEKPYDAQAYYKDFDKELWSSGTSFVNEKLIGLPFATAPVVTYYRADILEEHGFPSEPEALGNYIQDPENWLNMGEKLAKDSIYIAQWPMEPITITSKSQGYFNKDLEFKRNNDVFKQSLAIAREAIDRGMVPYVGIWDELGQTYLKNNQFAMLYLGSWGAKDIESWVPEQSGKWRVTRLPFDIYGWNNSTFLMIPQDAKEKTLAWEFIHYYTFEVAGKNQVGSVSSYLPFRDQKEMLDYQNEFLGGQHEHALYEYVMKQTEEYAATPLDPQAEAIMNKHINRGLERRDPVDVIMSNIEREIKTLVEKEKDYLKDYHSN